MNSDMLQQLRYALQKRVRRLNTAPDADRYLMVLRQFWVFLQGNDLIWSVIEDLRRRFPIPAESVEALLEGTTDFAPPTEEEQASWAIALIEHTLGLESNSPVYQVSARLGRVNSSKISDYAEQFHELVSEPLYEYVDEQLDTKRAVLGLLLRYKHRCEWFTRDSLFQNWTEATSRGERTLATDLYRYLFDEGVEFALEPTSASGEADLVMNQTSDDRLIADAKVFDPGSGKDAKYLAKGVNQLYIYTQDFNQPIGYLVVFKTSSTDLRFALSDSVSGVPVLTHNNKTLFILVIDIFPHETSASKRGKLKVVEVKEADLITVLE